MIIEQFLCGKDNFGFILHDQISKITIAIDAPDANLMLAYLKKNKWLLNAVFLTHHHKDHTKGLAKIAKNMPFILYVPQLESSIIDHPHKTLKNNDSCFIGDYQVISMETPGHTMGSFSYYFPQEKIVFVGDTLFSLGCGKISETLFEAAFYSLRKLRALNDETLIYPGHEYSYENAQFAQSIDPENEELKAYIQKIKDHKNKKGFMPPTTIKQEKAMNPFLRWDDPVIRKNLNMQNASDIEVFIALRKMKNTYTP